jgi:hypothetical protein
MIDVLHHSQTNLLLELLDVALIQPQVPGVNRRQLPLSSGAHLSEHNIYYKYEASGHGVRL